MEHEDIRRQEEELELALSPVEDLRACGTCGRRVIAALHGRSCAKCEAVFRAAALRAV